MKIEICDDVFDITKRIKEIDEGYFVVFDTKRNMYEVHNKNQESSYCVTVPYSELDSRTVEYLMMTSIAHIDEITEDIDNNNHTIEQNTMNIVKNTTDYMVREIYEFSSNSSKKFGDDSFSIVWR